MRVQRKLYGPKGTLLGTVVYPRELDDLLRRHGSARFAILPELGAITERVELAPLDLQKGQLSWEWREQGAVRLYGISLEEWEKIPGHSFAPSAAYLRSIIEGGS